MTDKFEWQRRPGFSIFCPTALADGEIVNQFYSSRTLSGTVIPFADTSTRLLTFSSSALNTVIAKSTTAQGYLQTIGNQTYFADGASADLFAWDGTNAARAWGLAAPTVVPTVKGLGFWQPQTSFPLSTAILDTNGAVEVVSSILIPNGAFVSPTKADTLALGGSTISGPWVSEPVHGGYAVTDGYRHVQQAIFNSGGTNTSTVTLTAPVAAGDVVVLNLATITQNFTASVTSITDNLGNVYAQQATGSGVFNGGGGNNYYSAQFVWTAPVTVGGTCTVTIRMNCPHSGLIHEYFGIGATATTSAAAFFVNIADTFAGAGTVTFTGTQLVYTAIQMTFPSGFPFTPSGFKTGAFNSSGLYFADAYAGATSSSAPTWFSLNSGSNEGEVLTAVFPITGLNTGYTPYLFLHDFNAGIPTGATITGIVVTLPKFNAGGAGTIIDQSVRLVIGGTPTGTDLASGTTWNNSGYTVAVYGSPSNVASVWGFTPTAAQLNANGLSGFGLVVSADVTNTAGGSLIPEVGFLSPNQPTVTVYFTLANGTSGPGISGANEPTWSTTLNGSVNDGGVVWTNEGPILTWFPATNYPTPVVILDPNGNLQLASYVVNPIKPWSSSTTYSFGKIVYFGGQYWISVFNGSNLNVVPTSNYSTATVSGAVTTNAPFWAITTSPLVTGLNAPVWSTTVGGTTTDGSYTWTNVGQGSGLAFIGYAYVYAFRTIYGHLTTASPFSNNTGAILGPLNATITSYAISSNVVTFVGNNNFLPGNVFQVRGLLTGLFLNEQNFTVISAVPSETLQLTQVAVNTNVLTITAPNNLVVGQTVTFSGVANATFLNGVTVTVIATGLSSSQFEANFTHTNYGPTSDSGQVLVQGSYTAAFTHANVSQTLDAGVAIPLIATLSGMGVASPLCNSVANITAVSVSANIVTITAPNNFQPGIWVTFSGLSTATFLNSQQAQVISVDQNVGTQNTQFQVFFVTPNYASTPDSGIATFNAIEIYRTSDGGGSYLFSGAITNPGVNGTWVFDDFTVDADLDALLVAPLFHQNDPPPGAPGSTVTTVTGSILTYWQGRLWLVAGNFVYFDAGPDCGNGIPEEAWPPGNRFQFPGPPLALIPTADGVGLLVYLADRVHVILGGPETVSFYATDALSNFGISNPNGIFRDGSIIGQFTTQKQYFELIEKSKEDIGEHIGDYLDANFTSAKSYVTMHRSGLDVGVFISNGVDRILRYGSNIHAWSVPAFPAMGAGALRSIETSVGIYSLMLATPTGGGRTSAIGPFNPTSGTDIGSSGPAWLSPGNITIGNPTIYSTVTFTSAGTGQTLRSALYSALSAIPPLAAVRGVTLTLVGAQTASPNLSTQVMPTNGGVGATSHTAIFGVSSATNGLSAFDQETSAGATVSSAGSVNIATPTINPSFPNELAYLVLQSTAGGFTLTGSWSGASTFSQGHAIVLGSSGSIAGTASFSPGGTNSWTALLMTFRLIGGSFPTFVHSNVVSGATSSGTNSTWTPVTGNTIMVTNTVANQSGNNWTVSDTLGNTYQHFTVSQAGARIDVFLAQNVIGGSSNTVTLSTSGLSTGWSVEFDEFGAGAFPTNTTLVFGGPNDLWGMPIWGTPAGAQNISFDLVPSSALGSTQSISIAEAQVTVTYQNPGNFLYARDVNSWGDAGTFGQNNGTPYPTANIVLGSITLSQPGARLLPLQHVVGYFNAVGTLNHGGPSQPDIWILPNEVAATSEVPFIQLPSEEVLQEPPVGQTNQSKSLLQLRWPLTMMNSAIASQLMHHLQVKIQFEPENAPNTIKAIAFKETND